MIIGSITSSVSRVIAHDACAEIVDLIESDLIYEEERIYSFQIVWVSGWRGLQAACAIVVCSGTEMI